MTYEDDTPMDTATRMVSMYKHSKYTPEERATDHAFAYDSHEAGRKFWIAVLQAMYQLKDGGNHGIQK
jgi:hypothetical protein